MIEALTAALPFAQAQLIAAGLVFLRVGAMVALMPGFGEQVVPMRIRLAVALAFTLIVLPLTPPAAGPILRLAASEVAAGLVFGVGLRLLVHALQIAGSIAAQATSLSQMLGAPSGEPVTAVGQILLMGGIAIAMILGLHVRMAEYILTSYDLFPAGQLPGARVISDWGTARVAGAFALGFSLAAPFVLAGFVYNLALGVINRAMPQLMVAFVGAPAITAGALVLLMLSGPAILWLWHDRLVSFAAQPGRP